MNKTAVIYSSLTGNTKEVAEAIYSQLSEPCSIYALKESPTIDLDQYAHIILGFWVDKSTADPLAAEFISKIHHKNIALFATVGAPPTMPVPADDCTDYGEKCLSNAAALLNKNCKLVHRFICQGRISAQMTAAFRQFPVGHPHCLTPERSARHQASQSHPDNSDLAAAKQFAIETAKLFTNEGKKHD